MSQLRQVSPGDSVDLPRPDVDGEERAYPNMSLSTVVYTRSGGWLAGWEAKFAESRGDKVYFPVEDKPGVIVAWSQVSVPRIADHQSFGLLVQHFAEPRFEAPDWLRPSTQARLLGLDTAVEREPTKARKVTRLGRPFKDPDAPTQVGLFGLED